MRGQRALVLALAVIAILEWVLGLNSTRTTGISYWIVDPQTVGVQVLAGRHEWCSVVKSTETASEVRITAECRDSFLPKQGSAVGIPISFHVGLAEPLGDRMILDGLGNPGIRCTYPNCRPPP